MKYFFFLLMVLDFSWAGATIKHDGTTLGDPRVYRNFKGDTKVQLTLIRLGDRSDKNILISFKVPGHTLNKQSFIYKEQCETTQCQKIFFTQKGGTMINLVSDSGYYGKSLYALMPGEKERIPLYYDRKESEKQSRQSLYKDYLHHHFLDRTPREIQDGLTKSLKTFQTLCGSQTSLQANIKKFQKSPKTPLLGAAVPVIEEIAKKCTDPMYKEILTLIQKIRIELKEDTSMMELTQNRELIIYLNDLLINPSIAAQSAFDKL